MLTPENHDDVYRQQQGGRGASRGSGQPGRQRNPAPESGGGSAANASNSNSDGSNWPEWYKTNPSHDQTSFGLPSNRTYGNCFMGANHANVRGWPRVPHHRTGVVQRTCVRYLTAGACNRGGNCPHAHRRQIDDPAEKQQMIARLRKIFEDPRRAAAAAAVEFP